MQLDDPELGKEPSEDDFSDVEDDKDAACLREYD
jgi:hypothetical protein